MYIREFLRSKNIKCKILEIDDPIQIPLDGSIYGITSTTAQFDETKKIVNYLKEHVNAPIIGGGPHITVLPEEAKKEAGFNKVVVGEGELKFYEIITGEKIHVSSIDEFPYPRISNKEIKYYHQYNKKILNFMTSRGCPFDCYFCASKSIWGRCIKYHSINYVKEALTYYHSIGFKLVRFQDDNFALDISRLKTIASHLKQLDMKWQCLARVDHIDEEFIDTLLSNGCTEIAIGVESGSQKILNICNKNTKVKDNEAAIKLCHNKGLPVRAFILLGLPGETKETLKDTMKFIENVPANSYTISVFCPYPGTEIGKYTKKFGITINKNINWSDYHSIGNQLISKTIVNEMKYLEDDFKDFAQKVFEKSNYGRTIRSLNQSRASFSKIQYNKH